MTAVRISAPGYRRCDPAISSRTASPGPIRWRWKVVCAIPERCPVVTIGSMVRYSEPAARMAAEAAAATSLSVAPCR